MSYDTIRALLRDVGPMTVSQLARLVPEMTQGNISKALGWMSTCTKNPAKRVHIQAWVYQDEIGRHYPRAVYAAGAGRHAKKPAPMGDRERQRRLRAKRKPPAAGPNSVWQLGARP